MKSILKVFKAVFLSFIIHQNINAQSDGAQNAYIKEPKAEDFTIFGNVPIIEYSGKFNLEIPLHTIKTTNLSDNISLYYNSSGFSPNKRSSEVGINWSLNAGGVITRSVQGRPDEHNGGPVFETHPIAGTLSGARVQPSFNSSFETNLFNLAASVVKPLLSNFSSINTTTVQNKYYEVKSDVFHFNFHGIAGKFYIDGKGNPMVIANNNENIEVVLTNIHSEPYLRNFTGPALPVTIGGIKSKITLKLDNGYVYEFGGTDESLSYIISPGLEQFGYSSGASGEIKQPTITAWYLTKVISPFGDELVYEYLNSLPANFGNIPQFNGDDDHLNQTNNIEPINSINGITLINYHENYWKVCYESYNDSPLTSFYFGPAHSTFCEGSNDLRSYETYKPSYLSSIKFYKGGEVSNYVKVTFGYQTENLRAFYTFGDAADNYALNKNAPLLTSMLVSTYSGENNPAQSGVIKYYDFIYTYDNNNSGKRPFLTKVKLNNLDYYNLEYYGINNLPPTTTKSIDHWGFWNQNDDTQSLVPNGAQDANGDIKKNLTQYGYIGQEREPSNTQELGMLKKIFFPTGGYSEFVYEKHDYAKFLFRTSQSNFLPTLVNQSGFAGGSRIKEIIDFDGTNSVTRRFEYKKENGESSGVLMDFPRYYYIVAGENPQGSKRRFATWKQYGFNSNSRENTHITYSRIVERLSDNSKIINHFTNYESHPDRSSNADIKVISAKTLNNDLSHPLDNYFTNLNIPLYQNYVGIALSDQSIERGKLIKQEKLNENNFKVEETTYKYNENPDKYNRFITNVFSTGGIWIQSVKIYGYSNYLTEKKVKQFFEDGSAQIESNTEYEYNTTHNYPIKVKSTGSVSNELQVEELFYPQDLVSSEPNMQPFIQNRILNTPVLKRKYVNATKIFEEKQIFNSLSGVLIKPYEIYSAKFPNALASIPNIGNLELQYTFRYDDLGNVIEIKQANQQSTSFIWAYDGNLPVAKIENIDYSSLSNTPQFMSILGHIEEQSRQYTNTQLISRLNQLRSNLSNYFVTTYVHKPNVGLQISKLPNGLTKYYYYDTFQRLIKVSRKNEALTNQPEEIETEVTYKYHTQN